MVNKSSIVQQILKPKLKDREPASQKRVGAFAPSNIALCKYWGKRIDELNLPTTPSLSISLGNLGAKTSVSIKDINDSQNNSNDTVVLNKQTVAITEPFYKRLINFIDLFRPSTNPRYLIETESNIPVGAGVASSACGFAALVSAFNQLYDWNLNDKELSILARLGSGSACRSLWQGFVEWHAGIAEDGMDSFGTPLEATWPELRIGLLLLNTHTKKISSREAMKQSVLTSPFYKEWPNKHQVDMLNLKKAISEQNFPLLGATAESNALAMHALMLSSSPPILYTEPSTIEAIEKIWHLRQLGLTVYFTQDAGPNLKLLFLAKDQVEIQKHFPSLTIVAPFDFREAKTYVG